MNDFETQLGEAMRAAVADAQPPAAVMELVRRRYRRRNTWLAAAAAAAAVVIVTVVPVVSGLHGGRERGRHHHTTGGLLFAGGGRLLLLKRGDLEWLYPDGREVQIARGFAGAAVYRGELLAWKHASPPGASGFLPHGCFDPDCTRIHDLSYYTMNLDGSDSRLVLPAQAPAGNTAVQYEGAQLSPDGSRLAYISQQLRNGRKNIFLGATELWSLDLATGQKTDLGPYAPPALSAYVPFAWQNNTTLLANSPDGRSIQLIDARNGNGRAYLTVTDPRLIGAYEHARPGEGHPGSISLEGWRPGPGPAVLAAAIGPRFAVHASSDRSAVVLVENGRMRAFAPGHSKFIFLAIRIMPDGLFLLTSQSGNCNCPQLWNSVTYIGYVHDRRLSHATVFPVSGASAVNPEGTVIALDEAGIIDIFPVPPPACHRIGKCLRFQMKQLLGRGTLLSWEP